MSKLDPLGSDWRPGAPSKYDPKYGDELVIHCRKGKTIDAFALKLNVDPDTLLEWKRKHPDFSGAYRRAKREAEQYMVKLGKRAMLGVPIGVDEEIVELASGKKKKVLKKRYLDVGVWKYFLACRFGWREDAPVVGDADDSELTWEYEDE